MALVPMFNDMISVLENQIVSGTEAVDVMITRLDNLLITLKSIPVGTLSSYTAFMHVLRRLHDHRNNYDDLLKLHRFRPELPESIEKILIDSTGTADILQHLDLLNEEMNKALLQYSNTQLTALQREKANEIYQMLQIIHSKVIQIVGLNKSISSTTEKLEIYKDAVRNYVRENSRTNDRLEKIEVILFKGGKSRRTRINKKQRHKSKTIKRERI